MVGLLVISLGIFVINLNRRLSAIDSDNHAQLTENDVRRMQDSFGQKLTDNLQSTLTNFASNVQDQLATLVRPATPSAAGPEEAGTPPPSPSGSAPTLRGSAAGDADSVAIDIESGDATVDLDTMTATGTPAAADPTTIDF